MPDPISPKPQTASPTVRVVVKKRSQGFYADRWREVLICEAANANDVHVLGGPDGQIYMSADLFPQAQPATELEITVKAVAK